MEQNYKKSCSIWESTSEFNSVSSDSSDIADDENFTENNFLENNNPLIDNYNQVYIDYKIFTKNFRLILKLR